MTIEKKRSYFLSNQNQTSLVTKTSDNGIKMLIEARLSTNTAL